MKSSALMSLYRINSVRDSAVAMHLPIIRNAAFCSGSALGAAAAFAATFSVVALAALSAGGGIGLSDMVWCVFVVVLLDPI